MPTRERSSGRSWVCVHTLANRFEGDLLLQALNQEQIPVLLRTYEETAYDGLFVPQKGWGDLLVPGEYEDAARDLIRGILKSADQGIEPAFAGEKREDE